MGSNCSNFLTESPEQELVITKPTKYFATTSSTMFESMPEVFTIEFIPLATTNPSLALGLLLQGAGKGFLERRHFEEVQLKKDLKQVAKGFLLRNILERMKENGDWSKIEVVEGNISTKTKLNLGSFGDKTMEKVKKVLEKEKMVKIGEGEFYQGEWDTNRLRSGFGVEVRNDRSTYVGDFEKNVRSGFGWLVWENKDCYAGHFENDRIFGKGKYSFHTGKTLIGTFKNGLLSGEGTEIWGNGTEYKGNFYKSQKHGTGVLKIQGVSEYSGEFVKDLYHGTGKQTLENGCTYDGSWKKGEKHGNGTFTWPNGKRYQGDYVNDKKHGKGQMKCPNKTVYTGDWENDLQHGKAVYTFFDKNKNRLRSINSLWEFGTKIANLTVSGELSSRDSELYHSTS